MRKITKEFKVQVIKDIIHFNFELFEGARYELSVENDEVSVKFLSRPSYSNSAFNVEKRVQFLADNGYLDYVSDFQFESIGENKLNYKLLLDLKVIGGSVEILRCRDIFYYMLSEDFDEQTLDFAFGKNGEITEVKLHNDIIDNKISDLRLKNNNINLVEFSTEEDITYDFLYDLKSTEEVNIVYAPKDNLLDSYAFIEYLQRGLIDRDIDFKIIYILPNEDLFNTDIEKDLLRLYPLEYIEKGSKKKTYIFDNQVLIPYDTEFIPCEEEDARRFGYKNSEESKFIYKNSEQPKEDVISEIKKTFAHLEYLISKL